jgi:hypothetical protein
MPAISLEWICMVRVFGQTPESGKQDAQSAPKDGHTGEIIIFPGLDFRKIGAAFDFWQHTGKPYEGAPD